MSFVEDNIFFYVKLKQKITLHANLQQVEL